MSKPEVATAAPLTEDELLSAGSADDIAALEAKYGGPVPYTPGESTDGADTPAPAPAASAPAADTPAPSPSPAPAPADTPAPPAPAATPAPTAAPAPASSAAPAAAEPDDKVDGVATPAGKVLPYGVLREARHQAAFHRERAKELEAENQSLKAKLEKVGSGMKPEGDDGEFTQEQLDEIAKDFPSLAPFVKKVGTLMDKVATAPAPAASAAPKPEDVADRETQVLEVVDAAMADRPLLSQYRDKGGVVWNRACEIDAQLLKDPVWASRPLADRFAETEKLLAQELGVALPTANAPAPTGAPAPAPAASTPAAPAAPAAPAVAPAPAVNTLSDLPGGTAPSDEMSALHNLTGAELSAKFSGMTDAQIDAMLLRGV